MDFTVTPNDKSKTFVIRREGQIYLIEPANEALFEYLKESSKIEWLGYLKRKPSNLIINSWTY
jgi:hypothetical protein